MGNILWVVLAGSLLVIVLYAIFFKTKESKVRRWSKEKPKTIDFVGLKNKEKHK